MNKYPVSATSCFRKFSHQLNAKRGKEIMLSEKKESKKERERE